MENAEDIERFWIYNNACCTIGEISGRIPQQVHPYAIEIVECFAQILGVGVLESLSEEHKEFREHFSKSVAISLGRVCLIDPQMLSSCLPKVIKPWCVALRYIQGSDEKAQAFRGLCAMIPYNPMGIADSFPYFCEALIEYSDPPKELE
jgi:transportin-1